MKMNAYKPHGQNVIILERAWKHVQSVPYAVSARWLFYRLYQDGIYTNKSDYKSRFLPLLSRARKEFYGEWRPWTLSDDTRQIITRGGKWKDERAWLQEVSMVKCELDYLQGQPVILVVVYEAKAMSAQFEHYLPNAAILAPFGGDPSIPAKWKLAEMLAARWEEYRVPVYVVYFGDYDEKGLAIEKTAMAEILSWAHAIDETGDYRWAHGGLNEDQVEHYDLPLSIEGRGYQWEALTDDQAKEIIEAATAGMVDPIAIAAIKEQEEAITARFKAKFKRLFLEN